MRTPRTLTIGTRGSALARWQTEWVLGHLTAAWPGLECQTRLYSTSGDRTQSVEKPLPEIGGKGLFTEELENALRSGEIDLAVHRVIRVSGEGNDPAALGAELAQQALAQDAGGLLQ